MIQPCHVHKLLASARQNSKKPSVDQSKCINFEWPDYKTLIKFGNYESGNFNFITIFTREEKTVIRMNLMIFMMSVIVSFM